MWAVRPREWAYLSKKKKKKKIHTMGGKFGQLAQPLLTFLDHFGHVFSLTERQVAKNGEYGEARQKTSGSVNRSQR